MMPNRLLIIGAGTAGILMAHHLCRRLPSGWEIAMQSKDQANGSRIWTSVAGGRLFGEIKRLGIEKEEVLL